MKFSKMIDCKREISNLSSFILRPKFESRERKLFFFSCEIRDKSVEAANHGLSNNRRNREHRWQDLSGFSGVILPLRWMNVTSNSAAARKSL